MGGGQGRVHVEVVASVIQPERGESRVSNTFNFVFGIPPRLLSNGAAAPLKRVLPSSHEEAAKLLRYYVHDA